MRKKKTGGQPKYATIGKYYASLKNNEVDVKKKKNKPYFSICAKQRK